MPRVLTITILLGCLGLGLSLGPVACARLHRDVETSDRPPLGHPNARKTVVVFSDFQCGFCQRVAAELSRLQRAHPTRFKVFFKHYPLAYHPRAEAAALAAEAARLQGKFWPMHDQLFANTRDLSDENLEAIARSLGLDIDQFHRDRASDTVRQVIEQDMTDGDRAGLRGTPYILIDGVPFFGMHGDLQRALLP
ncbi:MAG: thioredoxin domain-containing protein [Myxococcales bacterium]|jgi:protein-disulfide isomerase|nr:thioredoxin domain-containing protein [Myxococcales bacterium]